MDDKQYTAIIETEVFLGMCDNEADAREAAEDLLEHLRGDPAIWQVNLKSVQEW
jgi:hypothetical protein